MARLVHDFTELKTPYGPIKLERVSAQGFTVTYGLEITTNLNYDEAAVKLGRCLMHWFSSEGKLDNGR